jgi:hypothetical protein
MWLHFAATLPTVFNDIFQLTILNDYNFIEAQTPRSLMLAILN